MVGTPAPLIQSSLFLYDLRLGNFDTLLEEPTQDAEVLGYYPLVLYSKKTIVIPDISRKKVLQPLVLEQDPAVRSFVQFMGSTPNLDSKLQNFVLADVEVQKNLPVWVQSFYFYFDLLSRAFNAKLADWVRFNIAQFDLFSESSSNPRLNIFSLNIDLAYKSKGSLELSSNPLEILHSGELRIILNYTVDGEVKPTVDTLYTFGDSIPSGSKELRNIPYK